MIDKMNSQLMKSLQNKPLAFSSDKSLVAASSRKPLSTKDGSLLNVEIFDSNTNDDSPILLFTHGVCESAETLGVQAIVAAAKEHKVKVAVLELEGHGLSSGQRLVCGSFDRLLGHFLEFVKHSVPVLRGTASSSSSSEAPFFIAGNSLGGALSIYAAEEMSKNVFSYPSNFGGLATICPAVGVDKHAVPSPLIVKCLSLLSFVAPAAQLSLTPLEEPESYNCPADSERNFAGHWPLSTSKMLLDVTSSRIPYDRKNGDLPLQGIKHVLVIGAEKDHVVPIDEITAYFKQIKSSDKKLVAVPNAGHDILFKKEFSKIVTETLFEWIFSE